MNILDLALAAEALDDAPLTPDQRLHLVTILPVMKLSQGRRYLEACRFIQFSPRHTSEAVLQASERFHISETSMWRAWSHYRKVGSDL